MAKFVGFVGTISGKIGTTVFTKGEKGLSYGRSYQPVVANPKTIGQVDQRAKMNLVGRMSQVTPSEVLLGLGNRKRVRRSSFNKFLLQAATVDRSTPGVVLAKVDPEDVVFSEGAQALAASVTTPGATTGSAASIGLTLSDASLAGSYGERIVVAIVDPSDKSGYSFVKYSDVVFDNSTAKNVTVNFGTTIADESLVCIYRLPYLLTDEGASLRTQTLANNGTDVIAKILSGGNLVRDWGRSTLASELVFMQA